MHQKLIRSLLLTTKMSQQWTTAKKKKVYTNDEIKVVLDDIFSGKNVSEVSYNYHYNSHINFNIINEKYTD